MKSLLLNLKNLTPYLLLIALYFIFVNLEAKRDVTNYKTEIIKKKLGNIQRNVDETNIRISIPVIPYRQ